MNYFTADLHFGHKNILKYDNRPFDNIEEHNKVLIENWNKTVTDEDDVYILGDVSWYSPIKTNEIIKRLKGRIHLVVGNHDHKLLKNGNFRSLFVEITDYKELEIEDGKRIILSHYPLPFFKNHAHGWYHMYGHVHIAKEYELTKKIRKEVEEIIQAPCNMYNVGCMLWNYKPVTLEEVLSKEENK